jgi:hypothetical protein
VTGLRDAGIRGLYGHGLTPITSNTWSESKGGLAGDADPADLETRARLARSIRDEYFSSDSLLRFGIDCVSGDSGDMISQARLVLQASRHRADEPGYQQ